MTEHTPNTAGPVKGCECRYCKLLRAAPLLLDALKGLIALDPHCEVTDIECHEDACAAIKNAEGK